MTTRIRIAAVLLLFSLVAESLFLPVSGFAETGGAGSALSVETPGAPASLEIPGTAPTDPAVGASAPEGAGAATPAAIGVTPAAITTTGTAVALTASPAGIALAGKAVAAKSPSAAVPESLWYSAKNPMPKAHQQLLWTYCQKNGIGYIDMLALISTESGFNEKCVSLRKYYGYFQIGKGHFADLAASLKTKNTPLDGAVNIQWGTAMFGWIMADARVKKLPAEKRLDAALSIYQRGPVGYDRYGVNKTFLARFYKKRAVVAAWYAEGK